MPFLRRSGPLAFVLGLVAACRTTIAFDEPVPSFVATSPALPVTLSNELQRLRVKSSEAGTKSAYRIGGLLGSLFDARDGRAFLNLVAAEIHQQRASLGWQAEFRLVVALQREGRTETIEAEGLGHSDLGATEAGRAAIEASVERVYTAVRAELATPRR
jgi:hypothetical protein